MTDPSTGVVPRAAFAEAVKAPFGQAKEIIRKYDPLWGYAPGEKFPWTVKADTMHPAQGRATVLAETQEEADKLADELGLNDFDWDYDYNDEWHITLVEPKSE